jgi:hypothetical protein
MTTETAENYIRGAWQWGIISIVLSLVFAFSGTVDKSVGFPSYFNPMLYVDLTLTAALTWGTYRRNKFSALLLAVYYMGAKVYTLLTSGYTSGIAVLIVIVISYYLVQGARGAFFLNKRAKGEVR